ncbi:MAG: glycosyltransferase [Rhodanobacteraceae bacterium]|nr:glycosyltransferase [Rhodanobacteraceae bacterium]
MTDVSPGYEVPLISVAVLTFNHEKFLARALESVYAQEVRAPVEVIIAVDASDDSTLSIARKFAVDAQFPTLVLESDVRLGMQLNARRLMAATRGKYIALLEGDDYWLGTNKLEMQSTFLEEFPHVCGCATFAQVLIEPPLRREDINWLSERIPNVSEGEISIAHLATMRDMIPTASLMVRGDRFRLLPEWLQDLPMFDWYFSIGSAAWGGLTLLGAETSVYRLHTAGATLTTDYIRFASGFCAMLTHLCDETEGPRRAEIFDGLREFTWYMASRAENFGDGRAWEILNDLSVKERKFLGSVSRKTRRWRLRLRFPVAYSVIQKFAKVFARRFTTSAEIRN